MAGDAEGFGIAVAMIIHLPGIEKSTAEELVQRAHQVCPYSNAALGNIDVLLTVVEKRCSLMPIIQWHLDL